MTPFKPIEIDELESSPLAIGIENAGMPKRDAEWMIRLFHSTGFLGETIGITPITRFAQKIQYLHDHENIFTEWMNTSCPVMHADLTKAEQDFLNDIVLIVKRHKDRDAAIFFAFSYVFHNYKQLTLKHIADDKRGFVDLIAFQSYGVETYDWFKEFVNPSLDIKPINWSKAMESVRAGRETIDVEFAQALVKSFPREKKAFWLSAISWDLLSEAPASVDDRKRDSRRLDFWLAAGKPEKAIKNPEVGKAICGYLKGVPDSQLRVAALNLATVLTDSLDASEWQYIAPKWTIFPSLYSGEEEESILKLLWEQHQAHDPDENLQMALLRLFLLRFREGELTSEVVKPLVTTAKKELGQNRPSLKKDAENPFDPHSLNAPLAFLFRFGSPSQALETMLTLFSALEHPAVTPDLRYWKEEGLVDPPEPYRWIPDRIAAVIHALGDEQGKDAALENMRKSLAQFFLKRLKSKDIVNDRDVIDDDFIENRWEWRYFYVRALRELKINPLGKSHHVLRWVSENDPHEEVREEAKKAYKELRHQVSLPAETSPRKPLFAAFWWLRQAHLYSLEIKPDPQGAQRTRSKEVTYTNRN